MTLSFSTYSNGSSQKWTSHAHWVDFLTSCYCQFIRGKLNNHPLQQRRSAKYNPVKWWTDEHRMSFQLFFQLRLSSLQSSHRKHRHKIWKSRFWQTLTPPWEAVEASPRLSGQSQLPEIHWEPPLAEWARSPSSLMGAPSTSPPPSHLPSPCNISLSNKIMENLVCLYD